MAAQPEKDPASKPQSEIASVIRAAQVGDCLHSAGNVYMSDSGNNRVLSRHWELGYALAQGAPRPTTTILSSRSESRVGGG